jgi:DNA-binding NtrC family response regulator
VLLVEDEEQIRTLAKSMLSMLGFTVIEASNGKEALELYQKSAADISLVLTDMGMPIMDGYALFHELKQRAPALPIIISSGFGDAAISSEIDPAEVAGLISKPYNLDRLRDVMKMTIENTQRKM